MEKPERPRPFRKREKNRRNTEGGGGVGGVGGERGGDGDREGRDTNREMRVKIWGRREKMKEKGEGCKWENRTINQSGEQ